MEQSGGGLGPPPPPSLSAEFPEPERIPEVNLDFENVSFTDEQHRQDQARLEQLEKGRAKLEPGMHLRPTGEMADITQEVHTGIEYSRELEIKQIKARLQRHRGRSR